MAKNGFIFFQIDINILQDSRIRRLKRQEHGRDKFLVYFSILKAIYGDKGYYLELTEDTALDIAEDWLLDEDFVKATIEECCQIGLFHAELFKKGILTSSSIQARYTEMCKRAKRISLINPQISLIKSSEKIERVSEESTISSEESTQSSEEIPKNSAHAQDRIVEDRIVEDKKKTKKENSAIATFSSSAVADPEPVPEFENPEIEVGEEKKEPVKPKTDPCKEIMDFWNEKTAAAFPPITRMTDKRRKLLNTRLKEYGKEEILKAIERAARSDFLKGQNGRQWQMTFDWMILPNNFPKVLEGNYDNHEQQPIIINNNGNNGNNANNQNYGTNTGNAERKPYSRIQELGRTHFNLE